MEKVNLRKLELERTRQTILDVASELFMSKGFKNTATREIALKAGITQPNLYYHFKNKQELYMAVIQQLTETVRVELKPIVSSNDTIEVKLNQLVNVLIDKHPTNLFLMLNVMLDEMADEYQAKLYHIFETTYIDNIAAIFMETKGETALREDVSVAEATRFVLYNVSALLSIKKTYRRATDKDDIEHFIHFMLYGIANKRNV
jgi:AcrR family transcriptional regulator